MRGTKTLGSHKPVEIMLLFCTSIYIPAMYFGIFEKKLHSWILSSTAEYTLRFGHHDFLADQSTKVRTAQSTKKYIFPQLHVGFHRAAGGAFIALLRFAVAYT